MDIPNLMALLLMLAAALMVHVAVLSYRNRHLAIARTMIMIMLAATCYAVGYAFEVLGRTLQQVKLALHIEYLGIPFIATLWLLLVIQFTGAVPRYRRIVVALLFAIPVAVFALHLTNDWHGLVYERYILHGPGSLPLYSTVKGPWYYVHSFYNYLELIAGFLLFLPMYWRSAPIVRKQILILILGAAVPMLLNMLFWVGFRVDMTPFGFAVSGLVCVWGIFRFSLLRLTPLAQAKIFDTIRDGVVLLDHGDRIVSVNRAAGEVLPELAAIRPHAADAGEALHAYPALVGRVRNFGGKDERFPFQRREAGRNRHYVCNLLPLYDTGTEPVGKLLMFTDITELKENEERLRENARQLTELNAFKDKLFTVVAHDIRDPIALMVNLTELLGEEPAAADSEHGALLGEIRKQAHSAFHLVDNMLDWYRSQKGNVAFRPLAWNLGQVVRQALSLSGAGAGMKRIRLIERIDETLTVNADKEMLDLILRNLLSNAIKYTGMDGTIEVGATLEGDKVVVAVRDTGAGIDEATAALLRQEEPFLQRPGFGEEAEKTRFGLGLTREFVRINGGKLWFESVPGAGSTFSFTLPGSAGGRNSEDGGETEAEEEGYDESDRGG